ncbi:hypothetical protein M758_11G110600 [Ceratodon purpureus]|nr:hypothetical protein M758_11G110600 [Ceratodon purpureus]
MGGHDTEAKRKVNKEEPILSPRAHGGNEQEMVSETRARVDQLWRTVLATGLRELRSQRGGKQLTRDKSTGPVNVERQSDPSASSQDLRRPMESTAKTEGHPVEDVHERLQHPGLDRNIQSLISGSSAYANFFDNPCMIPSVQPKRPNAVPVRPTPVHVAKSSFGAENDLFANWSFSPALPATGRKNLDSQDFLDQQLGNTCPRSSQLLSAIVATAEAVEEHKSGSGTSRGLSSDFEEEEEEPHEQEQVSDHGEDPLMRAAITEHPLYPAMVLAHVRVLKVGAPSSQQVKLDEIIKKYQRVEVAPENISKLGQDPELDQFMRSYTEMLTSLRVDLEEPYNKTMQFMDRATKDLEAITGYYVDTKPDEDDSYGYEIAPGMDATQDIDEREMLEENLLSRIDVDESIVVDPDASDEELKKALVKKYGRHIEGLNAEFNRVRKKGKLPSESRQILKDWFNDHTYWPYPSEIEKAHLQRVCNLDLKQVNNWFINERKRHWSSEEKTQDPNTVYYDRRANPGGEGTSHQSRNN